MKMKILALLSMAIFSFVGLGFAKEEASKLAWSTDYAASLEKAKSQKKPLLIYFTGSDWCPFCIYMDRDVLSKPEFIDYANKNYVMVLCDFPRKIKLTETQAKANEALASKFGIRGFPTMVILEPQSGAYGFAGYENGITPKSFIDTVSNVLKKLDKAKK